MKEEETDTLTTATDESLEYFAELIAYSNIANACTVQMMYIDIVNKII